ncbi:nucleoid-associated protein [Zhongshania sp.]|uniref:nucleoid-associated protein n=1 Tax=Zhongshania sp. TaxID=1971902 RepID=UPI001B4078E2|nr:nucleoid-associated protein [Zhongshania sp.]MBQ0795213.1 nucleoid-associated protein [Zhongshania sp.]
MIDVSAARLMKVAVHRVGSKAHDEGISLAESKSTVSESLGELFIDHYLLPLSKQKNIYDFFHESDISLNAVANISCKMFREEGEFIAQTQALAKHLYAVSTHQNISSGDLLFLLYSGVIVNGIESTVLAVMKMENKDNFIEINENSGTFEVSERSGVSLNKIQKGALILPGSAGVLVVDNLGQKTKYWLDTFLKVTPRASSKSYAKICGSILKGVTSKIEDSQVITELNEEITEKINSSDLMSVGEIKSLSSRYIDSEALEEVMSGVASSTGIDISDNYEIKAKDVARQAKPITSRVRVRAGVGMIISDAKYSVSGISINDNSDGFQAIIDIKSRKKD